MAKKSSKKPAKRKGSVGSKGGKKSVPSGG